MKFMSVIFMAIFVLSACGTQNDSSMKQVDKNQKKEVAVNTEEKVLSSETNEGGTGAKSENVATKTGTEKNELAVKIEEGKSDHDGGDEHSMIAVTLDGKWAKKNNLVLSTTVKQEEQLVSGAGVRFEYWKQGEKHVYVEATDQGKGMYTKEIEAVSPGVYHVNVHVEKDDIHGHKPYKVTIN